MTPSPQQPAPEGKPTLPVEYTLPLKCVDTHWIGPIQKVTVVDANNMVLFTLSTERAKRIVHAVNSHATLAAKAELADGLAKALEAAERYVIGESDTNPHQRISFTLAAYRAASAGGKEGA